VLSHELKTPLNAIEGYLRMMQERQLGNDMAAYDPMIDRALSRIQGMRNLIMDLLDFTKIRFEKRQEHIRVVNVGELTRNAIQAFQPYAIQKGIEFTVSCNDPVLMEADPSDLEIVLNNLISNAVKYNIDNGKVTITISDTDKEVKIEVADTGIGMTTEEIEKVFREFTRIKNEKTKNIPGSGLGLAIVKKITELYNGSIEVESEPEKGSIFRIILPKKQKSVS
jgi:signal transduction histidine kinase